MIILLKLAKLFLAESQEPVPSIKDSYVLQLNGLVLLHYYLSATHTNNISGGAMNFLATYIMRGRMQAMIVASSLALLSLMMPPVSVVSSATVALVTLRRGGFEGLYVLVCSSLAAGILGFLATGNYQFALLYVMVLWLPVWLISIVLREGQHLSLAVEIAILLGIIGVVASIAKTRICIDEVLHLNQIWECRVVYFLKEGTGCCVRPFSVSIFSSCKKLVKTV